MSEQKEKYCPRCQQTKISTEFYEKSNGKLSDYCKLCWREKRKEYKTTPKKKAADTTRKPVLTDSDKWCKRCNDWKPLDEFYKVGDKYSGYCKTHQNEYRRERRVAANPTIQTRVSPKRNVTDETREGEKWCPKCKAYLPLDQFYKRGPNSHLYTSYCKKHHNMSSAARAQEVIISE